MQPQHSIWQHITGAVDAQQDLAVDQQEFAVHQQDLAAVSCTAETYSLVLFVAKVHLSECIC